VEEYVKNSILSVHMLPLPNGKYLCLDYSKEMFGQLVQEYGSVDAVYRLYLQQLLQIAQKPFGKWTPPRIGHLNLIQKFEQAYPTEAFCFAEWFPVLDAIRSAGFILDLNMAGIDKPLYGKTYPSPELIEEAVKRGIPFVPGSDSHQAETVGRYFPNVRKQLPSQIYLLG
jgi:histidinol-phosphatase (PHP family)